jgi:hypothetical protein
MCYFVMCAFILFDIYIISRLIITLHFLQEAVEICSSKNTSTVDRWGKKDNRDSSSVLSNALQQFAHQRYSTYF